MEDIYNVLGPRNQHWIKKWIHDTLDDCHLTLPLSPSMIQVIERVLNRLFPISPGCPLGLLIAFEVSKTTSQKALDSGHLMHHDMAAASAIDKKPPPLLTSFYQSISFSGIISQRKDKTVNFMHCEFKPNLVLKSTWILVTGSVYAIPLKDISLAVANAKTIKFITQPYHFENEFIAWINTTNMYSYLATQDQLDHLLPLFHLLATVSCQCNPPAAFTRHGLKRRQLDFLTRGSFEDVISAILDASLDRERVTSETIIGALMTSTQPRLGTHYMDLIHSFASNEDKTTDISRLN